MKFSAPIVALKRRAKLLARDQKIPLNEALDMIAVREGFARWSMLSSNASAWPDVAGSFKALMPSDCFLIASRAQQGKTKFGLRLLIEAIQDGRQAAFFTLEMNEDQVRQHLTSMWRGSADLSSDLQIFTSDLISADYIIEQISHAKCGTIVVVDYLQLLDQQRWKPSLSNQLDCLSAFAKRSGVIFGLTSQIARSFEAGGNVMPVICNGPLNLRTRSPT
jgi:replicative DNA helicase